MSVAEDDLHPARMPTAGGGVGLVPAAATGGIARYRGGVTSVTAQHHIWNAAVGGVPMRVAEAPTM